ncbi:unnamed protein product, partial [Pocillopora meandrina]
MKCQYAVGTLVVPFWPSAHYWSLIMHRYGDSLVAHVICAAREVLIHGRNHNSLLGSHQFTGYIIALRMEFTEADATAKSYMRVIKKFLDWCKSKQISFELPFPLGVVSLYLFEVQQSCSSSSSVILTHAALKWLHSFVLSLDGNPLDSDFCRSIIESAKRQRSQPIAKKKPITTEIIRNILDIHNKEDSNLKDLRIAAICSLAFAGFLRYDDLCNIVPKHIEFHNDYIRIFLPRSKTDIYREGN